MAGGAQVPSGSSRASQPSSIVMDGLGSSLYLQQNAFPTAIRIYHSFLDKQPTRANRDASSGESRGKLDSKSRIIL